MSTVKVNKIEKRSGSTLTLGGPGTAVTLACGATQTGFGRTGTVDWCTTAKTSPFTAVSGDGFFLNTTGGAITVTLPSSPSAGDIVAFKDYANTWDSNAATLCRNGSKIGGECANGVLNTESQSVTLIYVDGTKGWQDIHDSTANIIGNPGFVAASGGTETTSPCGNFKIHTFTASGCFAVSNISGTGVGAQVSYMVVAGGGSGSKGGPGTLNGAGGGAGGFREGKQACGGYTASPLATATGLPVGIATYPITIGAGGAAIDTDGNQPGNKGSNSVFNTITSAGGGSGRMSHPALPADVCGGSGGGGAAPWPSVGGSSTPIAGGSGNQPPVSPPQGNPGGTTPSNDNMGGGGGGAGAVGGNASSPPNTGGAGGNGVSTNITSSPVGYAGGGGGAGYQGAGLASPTFGGGNGGSSPTSAGSAGTANRGGGGGGGVGNCSHAQNGGSGVVIIRYKFQ